MIGHVIGLILLGLGIQPTISHPSILGVETTQSNIATQLASSQGASSSSGVQMPIVRRTKLEIQKEREILEEKRLQADAQYKIKRDALKGQFERAAVKNVNDLRVAVTEESAAYKALLNARIARAAIDTEEQMLVFTDSTAKFTNTTKKTSIENIQSRITALVQKRVNALLRSISKMEDIISFNKTQVLERATGKDTKAFTAAALQALIVLNQAKDDLSELAVRSYVIIATSEGTARVDAKDAFDGALIDITSAQTLLKNARLVTSNMIRERAKLLGEPVPLELTK